MFDPNATNYIADIESGKVQPIHSLKPAIKAQEGDWCGVCDRFKNPRIKALLSAFAAFCDWWWWIWWRGRRWTQQGSGRKWRTLGILRDDRDFKRVGSGLLGCHDCLLSNFQDFTSLLCSILSYIAILLVNCLKIPRITTWSIIVLFLMALGLPWWGIHPVYSTISLIKFQLPYQLPCSLKFKNIEHALRGNTLLPWRVKFNNRRSRHQLQCAPRGHQHQIKGWKQLPLPAPNILVQLPNQSLCSGNNPSKILVDSFIKTHDPSWIMDFYNIFDNKKATKHIPKPGRISASSLVTMGYRIDLPHCYLNDILNAIQIVDTGSVCITPHCSDFITYQPSSMKIKDLSSINRVKGEGILWSKVEDSKGNIVVLDLQGYHVESAEMRLLSPQVLLATYGGETCQTIWCIQVSLTNRISFNPHFCPRSCLPLLPFYPKVSDSTSFWASAFTYLADTLVESQLILSSTHMNLSALQKELLFWHQRLSHVNVTWIQTLIWDR